MPELPGTPGATPPAELDIAERVVAPKLSPTMVGSPPASPGLAASSAALPPTAPTITFDPAQFTSVLANLATAMYRAPPNAGSEPPGVPSPTAPAAATQPTPYGGGLSPNAVAAPEAAAALPSGSSSQLAVPSADGAFPSNPFAGGLTPSASTAPSVGGAFPASAPSAGSPFSSAAPLAGTIVPSAGGALPSGAPSPFSSGLAPSGSGAPSAATALPASAPNPYGGHLPGAVTSPPGPNAIPASNALPGPAPAAAPAGLSPGFANPADARAADERPTSGASHRQPGLTERHATPAGLSPGFASPSTGARVVPDSRATSSARPAGLSQGAFDRDDALTGQAPAGVAPGASTSHHRTATAPNDGLSAGAARHAAPAHSHHAPSEPATSPTTGWPDDFSLPLFVAPPSAGQATHGLDPRPAASSSPFSAPLQLESVFSFPPSVSQPPAPRQGKSLFDADAIRRQFPILEERVHGKRLVWLDNAATTQKPNAVIDRLSSFYRRENSNIHRAAHTLAGRASDAYEQARESTRRFINAPSARDIIFVRGTTEGINLLAQTYGRRHVEAGDEIVISWLEHHANIVPWQMLAREKGATLKVAPVDDRGQVILEEYERLLTPRTRIVSLTQVSNALGTITPIAQMVQLARRRGATVIVDGAQAVSHMRVDVQQLDCDFYVFSGHKVFGPTGIGAVYGRAAQLEQLPPWQGGGNMIEDVTFERTRYQPAPARFEAGTGNIADAVGLGAALDWVSQVGIENIGAWEHSLLEYATERLHEVRGLHIIGTAPDKAGVISFVLDGHVTQEMSAVLDHEGIAVRSGHHCAQPILRRFGVEATVRASFAPYNTFDDVDVLADALHRLQAGR